VRGVWICRSEEELIAVLLCQNYPRTALASWPQAKIRLNTAQRRMAVQAPVSGAEWAELNTMAILAKPLIIALQMLRALSPEPKPEASPGTSKLASPGSGSLNQYVVRVLADAAKLVRVPDPAKVADWYVMRGTDGEPYTEPKSIRAHFTLQDGRAFADIDGKTIEDAMLAALAPEQS
jgi:hypothetical protein